MTSQEFKKSTGGILIRLDTRTPELVDKPVAEPIIIPGDEVDIKEDGVHEPVGEPALAGELVSLAPILRRSVRER